MRFVSHAANFQVQVVPERVRFTQYGDRIVDREGFIAQFNQNDINDGDVEFAERTFGKLNGRTTEIDEITLTPLLHRISVFDTEEEAHRLGWEDQTVEDGHGIYDKQTYIEQVLAAHSIGHPDYRLIEEVPLDPPWPRYLEYKGTAEQLIAKLEADGHDLTAAARYERQLGTRPEVIEALGVRIAEQIVERENVERVLA